MEIVTRENTDVAQAAQVTPMQMLQMAVSQGADLDKLTKLMDLQERWEANEARKAFVAALNAFKANPPDLHKNKGVSYGQGDRKTEYRHATLDHVSIEIGKALSQHGLSHRWDTEQLEGGMIRVTCVLTHDKGHSERTALQAGSDTSGSKNSIQAIGSTVTYLQRYTLLAATGMAVKGQDDDGIGGEVKGLPENQRIDFENAIDGAADLQSLEALWQKALTACNEAYDKPAYDALKARVKVRKEALTPKKEKA